MKFKLLAAASALSLLAGPALAQDAVKIGYVTTLSGPTAIIGEDMKNSVELALDHLGRKMCGKPVEIIYEDDQQKPDVGKQKTDKLVTQDKVPFVIAVSPATQDRGLRAGALVKAIAPALGARGGGKPDTLETCALVV